MRYGTTHFDSRSKHETYEEEKKKKRKIKRENDI
jgi:hypothetical protein